MLDNQSKEIDESDKVQDREVHMTFAGLEHQILQAIELLDAIQGWVSHKKLLELIDLTKNELFGSLGNPYCILKAYNYIDEMKQEKLGLIPEDFTWFTHFVNSLAPVLESISIPLKLVLLKKNDEELFAISTAQSLCYYVDLQPIFERKLEDIAVLLRYLTRQGYSEEIIRLASMGELTYPIYISGGV